MPDFIIKIEGKKPDKYIAELTAAAESSWPRLPKLVRERLNRIFNTADFGQKLFSLKSDNRSTRTGKSIMRFNPTDFFRDLLAAFRTGDFDSFFIKHEISPTS